MARTNVQYRNHISGYLQVGLILGSISGLLVGGISLAYAFMPLFIVGACILFLSTLIMVCCLERQGTYSDLQTQNTDLVNEVPVTNEPQPSSASVRLLTQNNTIPQCVADFLDYNDLTVMHAVRKGFQFFYNPILIEQTLTHSIMHGKPLKVIAIVKKQPTLLFKELTGPIMIDPAGRQFHPTITLGELGEETTTYVTPFKLMRWYGEPMQRRVLAEVPPELRSKIDAQNRELMHYKLTYSLHGQPGLSRHYELTPVIAALIQLHAASAHKTPEQCFNDFNLIGKALRDVPFWIAQLICSRRPPQPTDLEAVADCRGQPFIQVRTENCKYKTHWFDADSGFGENMVVHWTWEDQDPPRGFDIFGYNIQAINSMLASTLFLKQMIDNDFTAQSLQSGVDEVNENSGMMPH